MRYLVANANFVTVPSATSIGQVENLREVRVQIWLIFDTQLVIVVLFPDVFAVERGARATVHTNATYRNYFT